jgi:hypothetical protein
LVLLVSHLVIENADLKSAGGIAWRAFQETIPDPPSAAGSAFTHVRLHLPCSIRGIAIGVPRALPVADHSLGKLLICAASKAPPERLPVPPGSQLPFFFTKRLDRRAAGVRFPREPRISISLRQSSLVFRGYKGVFCHPFNRLVEAPIAREYGSVVAVEKPPAVARTFASSLVSASQTFEAQASKANAQISILPNFMLP